MTKKDFSGDTRLEKTKPIKKRLIREEHGSQVITFGRNFFPSTWSAVSVSEITKDTITIKRLA